jgi:DNA-binding IclR family transcriptional regulator
MSVDPPFRPSSADKDSQFATTLSHGIDILASFGVDSPLLGNKDFVQRTGLSKSAVARLTHTLVQLGYLRRDTASGKYRLGAAVLVMGYPLLASMQLRQIARPLMKQLAGHTNGAVSLVVRDRLQMIYVETARSNEALQTRPDIGAALPMLASAAGRAWLCQVNEEERTEVLNRLRLASPEEYTRHQHAVTTARQELLGQGYCGNDRHWHPDAYGLAVPLAKPYQSQWFVFNCGIPASEGTYKRCAAEIGPRLVSMVRNIEQTLGLR